jgi:hypothetical protein
MILSYCSDAKPNTVGTLFSLALPPRKILLISWLRMRTTGIGSQIWIGSY